MVASHPITLCYISAKFVSHPLALLSRGAGSFAAEGLNLNTTAISYQLSAAAKGRLQGTGKPVPCKGTDENLH